MSSKSIVCALVVILSSATAFAGVNSSAKTCSLSIQPGTVRLPSSGGQDQLLAAEFAQILSQKGYDAFRSSAIEDEMDSLIFVWSEDCRGGKCVYQASIQKGLVYEFPFLILAKSNLRPSLAEAIADLPNCPSKGL